MQNIPTAPALVSLRLKGSEKRPKLRVRQMLACFECVFIYLYMYTILRLRYLRYNKSLTLLEIIEPGHEKMCLMS